MSESTAWWSAMWSRANPEPITEEIANYAPSVPPLWIAPTEVERALVDAKNRNDWTALPAGDRRQGTAIRRRGLGRNRSRRSHTDGTNPRSRVRSRDRRDAAPHRTLHSLRGQNARRRRAGPKPLRYVHGRVGPRACLENSAVGVGARYATVHEAESVAVQAGRSAYLAYRCWADFLVGYILGCSLQPHPVNMLRSCSKNHPLWPAGGFR